MFDLNKLSGRREGGEGEADGSAGSSNAEND